ncbi:hypothetical protein G5714_017968 [Onychostoma macrolepis]|uniref:Receptor ligand binding region domain-containing protein n=1 Tax=Onychostoma macrolepis TaxID=369639 RepID=A0A7J6C2T7_9TELE|nr:hypothetical protein G5714_017968 [Onychostoma macrolepis]
MPDLNCTYKPGPVKCNGFDPRAFRWALTMKLAVEEINKRADLLPNYSLGYKIFDSCAYPLTGQRSAVAVLNGPNEENGPMCEGAGPLLAIIGESGSAQSIVVSRILRPFGIPMISYFSSCACLSDRREFPTFFRVIPSDAYQVKAIAKLLLHFKWTWVGVIRGDHEYGRFALQGLLKELEGTGICVAYQEMIPLLYERQRALEIIRVMNHSTARVVVVFSAEGELTPFLRDYMEQNVTGIQWIASEAWVTASVFTGSEYYPFLGGTIGFGIRQGQIPGLREYLTTVNPERYPSNPLAHELWGALYGCSPSSSSLNSHLPSCTGKETLRVQHSAYFNTSSPRISYNVYKGVYAIAYSLHNLIHCTPGKGPFSNSTCANLLNVYPWQLQQYLQEVSFTISGETVKFDMKGDSIPSYDLINWQRGSAGNIEFVNVGMFDGAQESGQELVIQEKAIMWPGHQTEASCSHSVFQYMRFHVLKFCRVKWSVGFREMRFVRAFEFAIEEINNSSDLLPGVTLGYHIYDSCASVPMAVKVAFQLANGLDLIFNDTDSCAKSAAVTAVVAESGSTPSISISRLLGPFGIPQVSHYATCACLSDKRQYPTFFRTIPSDHHQAAALARMVKHFGWTWIGAVRSDSDYGNNGMASFLKAAEQEGICVEYSEAYYRTQPRSKLKRVAEVIRRSMARVIVAFLASGDMRILLEELSQQPPPPMQWIGSEAWVTDPEMLRFNLCIGAVGFGIPRSVIPGFRNFLLDLSPQQALKFPLLTEFWESSFSCSLKRQTGSSTGMPACDGTEDLRALQNPYTDTSQLRITNMVYKATYAIAHALDAIVCNKKHCDKNVKVEARQVFDKLKQVNFTQNNYHISFDTNGDPVATYELVNWQIQGDGSVDFVTVGHYDASQPKGHEFRLSRAIIWNDGKETA